MSLVLQSLLPYPNSCQGTSPHQQGWDTKMAMLSFCGIDVSKDRLDVVVLPEGWFFSVSNDTAGWAELVARLRPLTVSAIGLEPSGGYERGIIRPLLAAGLSVRRINPNKLRQFARARGVLAKAINGRCRHGLRFRLISDVGAKGARSATRLRDLSCGALAFGCIAGDYQNRTADCPQTASNPAPDPLTCSGDDGGTAGQRFEHRKLLPSLSARLKQISRDSSRPSQDYSASRTLFAELMSPPQSFLLPPSLPGRLDSLS